MAADEEVGARLSLKDRRKFAQDAKDSARDIEGIGKAADKASKQAATAASPGGGFGMFAKGLGGLKIAAGGVGALAALAGGAAAKMGLDTASGMEQANIGFTTMLGSAEKARAFLGDLSMFAAKTPFEFPELQTASNSLIAAGIDASKIIPIMTTLGDVTAGVGTGADGVQRATIAIQQMNAANKISGEDLNQLRDAGIPVYNLLAKATGKTTAEVVKLAQSGKLGKKELDLMMKALETGKGLERFNGMMAKQSQSLSGIMSTAHDTVNMALANMVQPAIPAIKSGINGMVGLMQTGATKAIAFQARAISAFKQGKAAISGNGLASAASKNGGLAYAIDQALGGGKINGIQRVLDIGSNIARVYQQSVAPAFADVGRALGPLAVVVMPLGHIDTILTTMANHGQATRIVITGLVGAFLAYKTASLGIAAADKIRAAATWFATVRNKEDLAVSTAQRVARMGMAAATGIVTAAQWAWNAALSANPIGLVIVGIAALAGGLVLLWKRSETFRNVVFGVWGAIRGFFSGMPKVLLGTGKAILNALTWPYREAVKTIISAWNAIDFGISVKIPSWVPGVGGKGFSVKDLVPDIPMPAAVNGLANGGTTTSSGTVLVGERGPELLNMPKGASVVPLDNPLAGALAQQADGRPLVVQVVVDRKVLAEATLAGVRAKRARE